MAEVRLYRFASSPFSAKVIRALNAKGLSFEVEEVNRLAARRGKYDHVSPTAKFPAITLDCAAYNDSTDIIEALDRYCPDPALIPKDPHQRAMAHAIEEWADESLYFYEMLMRVGWEHNLHSSYAEIKATAPPLPDFILKRLIQRAIGKLVTTQGVGRKPREQVIRDAERHVTALDGFLSHGDWLVGDALSVADLAVIAQVKKLLYASEFAAIVSGQTRVTDWIARVDEAAPDRV